MSFPHMARVPVHHVLIVDADPDAGGSLAMLLAIYGHQVRVARHARQALEMASAQTPDVVLAELVLPGLDGYKLAGLLREKCPKSTLVALTTQDGPDVRARVSQAGYRNHLVKGGGSEALLGLLASLRA